ncbi:MAG TPA: hypothetical protein VF518_01695, partial [Polyangia bacterium]
PDLMLAEVTEACTLIQEAADPDANIIFGSVIDPNMKDEVRLTVIATGFQSRTAVEASTSHSRPAKKPGEGQMVLPISSAQASPTVIRVQSTPSTSPPPVPTYVGYPPPAPIPVGPPRAAMATPASVAVPEIVDFADTAEDDYAAMAAYPAGVSYTPAPVMRVAAGHSAPVSIPERTVPMSESRPLIRPAVTSPMSVPGSGPRRSSGTVPVALAADHLGIEESIFDKPTYLRRAMAGEMPHPRQPGDGSKL